MAPADVHPAVIPDVNYYSSGLRQRYHFDGILAETDNLAASKAQYANLAYEIDEAAFRRRSEARLAAGGLPTSVPPGWPTKLTGPLVWGKEDFNDESGFVYLLEDGDKAEILDALAFFCQQGLDGHQVSPETFPLPSLGSRLQSLASEVYQGRGFAVLRGLNPDDYSVEDMTVIYLGLSSYVGERRGKQDQRGSMLMHVIKKNDGIRDDPRDDAYSQDKPFHTDTVADCICLFAKSLAQSGGHSILASSWTVYNELAATRPDLIHVLSAPDWPFDTFGRNPSYYTRPILFHYHAKIIITFSRRLLVGRSPFQPRSPGIPGLTEAQAEALDAVHFIARKHEIKPSMKSGDLRFINNMAVLHRRDAFENGGNTSRHLIRLWLNNQTRCWSLPAPLQIAWARIFDDDERDEHWDIEPPREKGKILRVAGSCD